MTDSFPWRKLGETLRLRVEITAAIARERILETHAEYALQMIEAADGRVPVLHAFEIYERLLRLSEQEAMVLRNRVLAQHPAWTSVDESTAVAAVGPQRSMFQRIRRRLRGRVDPALRHAIELALGSTEVGLFRCHVDNAVRLAKVLEPSVSAADAVQLYCDLLGVRSSQLELLYHHTLSQLREDQLLAAEPLYATEPVEVHDTATSEAEPAPDTEGARTPANQGKGSRSPSLPDPLVPVGMPTPPAA